MLRCSRVMFGDSFERRGGSRGQRGPVLPPGHGRGRGDADQLPVDGPERGDGARRRHAQAAALHPHAAGGLLPRQGRAGRRDQPGAVRPAPAVARFGFGVRCRQTLAAWATFVWVFLLGSPPARCSGSPTRRWPPRRGRSAPSSSRPPLILQFISGVYFAFSDMPAWLQQVAALFPLKWVAQGMRSVFFPAACRRRRWRAPGSTARSPSCSPLWLVAGLFLCARTFPGPSADGMTVRWPRVPAPHDRDLVWRPPSSTCSGASSSVARLFAVGRST